MKKRILSTVFPILIFIVTFTFSILFLIAGLGISITMLIVVLCCFGCGAFPIYYIIKHDIDISKHFSARVIVTALSAGICGYSWTDINLFADGYVLYIPAFLSIVTSVCYFFIFRKNKGIVFYLLTNPILCYTLFVLGFAIDFARDTGGMVV